MPVTTTVATAVAKAYGLGSFRPIDPNFKQTVLLLHGDGTNGAQNNTFIDGSTNNFTITRNGNTTQGTFSPFSQAEGGWSNYFDGTGDYLALPSNTAFDVGTGDFTVEMWVNPSSLSSAIFKRYLNTTSAGIELEVGKFRWWKDGSSNILTSTTTAVVGTWYHIAYSRSGTSFKLYVNGTEESSATNSDSFNFSLWDIGRGFYGNQYSGYISNFRIVKGTAVYTSAFTPPTAPLTAITNTSLLTCQSNRFVDNSSNNFAITRNGDVRVTAFSPFAPTAAYDAATNGGSGYADGTGDYLSGPSNTAFQFGTGDFTFEYWVYPLSFSSSPTMVDTRSTTLGAGLSDYITTTGLYRLYSNGDLYTSTATIRLASWTHIAVSRVSGTIYVYINGVRDGSFANTTNFSQSNLRIFANVDAGGTLNGYLSDVRIVKGTGLYSGTTLTLPTAPLTAITNTSLLLNFTNAGIIDSTGKNVLETVGNAQIDTTTKKYGTGSLEFDGTGDYLKIPSSVDFQFGTGDLTVECWFYANSFSSVNNNYIVDFRPSASNGYPLIFIRPNGAAIWLFVDGAERIVGSSISTGQWYHLAWTRSGNSSKLFLNGTQTGSTWTDTTNYLAGRPQIAAAWDASSELNGFIDDLRITKGVARYTANFTPPVRAFEDR